MIVIIAVLATLLLIALTAIICLWQILKYLIVGFEESQMSTDEQLIQYLTENTVKEFPCTLLLTGTNDANYEKIIDFSKYEEYGIIGLMEYLPKMSLEEDSSVFIPNQKILLLKDGSYEWDVRPYL